MKSIRYYILIVLIPFLFIISGCQQSPPKVNPALSNIDLLRGELLLCNVEQFGEVSFALSCSDETRETFDLALSLLHSFEYTEAEKAFVKVIDIDPDCAMAYWGVSMSIFHSLWMQTDTDYLKKGQKLLSLTERIPTSERERDYLDAISVFYNNWESIDNSTRKLMYEEKMKALYIKHKDDTEAAVFYALAITAASDPNDKTYAKQRKAGKILDDLFLDNPNHPGIAHYIIHSYDYPELAGMALPTARRYAQIAPSSAHAQHMPSHIFTRLGLWDESISTNINSAFSATCYAERINPEANWSQEIHAIDYMVYAYLQLGQNAEAMEQLAYMQSVTDVFPKGDFAATYAMVAIPVRVSLENKQWEEASNLEFPSIDLSWEERPWQSAMMHFGKALGYAHLGDIKAAETELAILQSLHQDLLNVEDSYKAKQVMIQIKASEGWIELAKGNDESALALMTKAAELESQTSKHPVTPGEVLPADELLGDMLLALNKPNEALAAYEVNLEGHPNRFNGLYGAAIAAKQAGDTEKAKLYFEQLLILTQNSNSDRPEIAEAKEFIGQSES